MKKKIGLILMLAACMCLLASCGSSKKNTYSNGYTDQKLEKEQTGIASQLSQMTDEQLKQYEEQYSQQSESLKTLLGEKISGGQADIYENLFRSWRTNSKGLGNFESFGKFSVAKSGKTITTTLNMKYSKRNARLVAVYNTYDMSVSSMNFEPIYTLGETMGKAALNVVMGMVTVFAVLILICLVIYAFRIIPYLQKKHDEKQAQTTQQTAAPDTAGVVGTEPEEDAGELVAVISAAIAASTGASTDSFVVRNIKRRY